MRSSSKRALMIALAAPLSLAWSIPTPNPNVILGKICAHVANGAGTFQIDNVLFPEGSHHRIRFAEGGVATVREEPSADCIPERRFRFAADQSNFRASICLEPIVAGDSRRRVEVLASGSDARRVARQMWSFQSCQPPNDGSILLRDRVIPLGFKADLDTTGLVGG